ncbi:hypothetical protein [Haloglomus litoreum]|uniref:hypothetical protein n=1 Tax=Haloglomus litoreum TaxID=3034026 RepID=UPI0023E86E98|nr:hypothetical protein [Haloglomus sp. DT116]
MPPIFGVWNPTEPKLLRRVHDRLSDTAGCTSVRYVPSRLDANEVVAEIDPSVFLGRSYPAPEARLRVEFDLSGDRPHYWIQWWEPTTGRSIGRHADDTEPEFGPAHFQVEYGDGTTDRRVVSYPADDHPYRVFEYCLSSIDDELRALDRP